MFSKDYQQVMDGYATREQPSTNPAIGLDLVIGETDMKQAHTEALKMDRLINAARRKKERIALFDSLYDDALAEDTERHFKRMKERALKKGGCGGW